MLLILIKLAWKNILRNKRRTLIAATAISIGLAALIFVDAYMIGMKKNMIKTATASFIGDAQIHREGFRDEQEATLTIQEVESITRKLAKESIVHYFTRRTYASGMIRSAANMNRGIILVGIFPGTERFLSQIDDAIIAGNYFKGGTENDIVLGSKLADILEVEVGDRVPVTVSQAYGGEFSQVGFRVSGIFEFADERMNSGMAFVRIHKAQEMLGIGSDIHEIAIKFTSTEISLDKDMAFWDTYDGHGNEIVSWTDILPQIKTLFEISNYSKYIMGFILFIVVAFGIVNTLFMSLYERMFEFGVLRAVGTRPFGMARLILFEAGALAVVSIAIGVILGSLITGTLAHFGINFTGIEMMGVTIQEYIYPVLAVEQFIMYPISVFLFTIIAGLYPAWHVARMSPVDAMRQSF